MAVDRVDWRGPKFHTSNSAGRARNGNRGVGGSSTSDPRQGCGMAASQASGQLPVKTGSLIDRSPINRLSGYNPSSLIMLPTLIRKAAQEAKPSNEAWLRRIRELYPPKKVWPPDFKKLSLQEQLKYEKKYKRRLALATARPQWTKFIKLVQLFSVTCMWKSFLNIATSKHAL